MFANSSFCANTLPEEKMAVFFFTPLPPLQRARDIIKDLAMQLAQHPAPGLGISSETQPEV